MLIKEFWIKLYGPLRDRGCALTPGFNLLTGCNEAGKTLTIDALVKLLLGNRAREKEFPALQRVGERPEGYVLVEAEPGKTRKLPEEGDLAGLAGLSAGECANLFIIRNSDLSIAGEGEFYTAVTDRLTGLRTAEIAAVIKALRETARLTPTGAVRDVGEEKLRSRLEQARALDESIAALLAELREAGHDRLEEELVEAEESLRTAARKLDSLEQARKRELYEKGREALAKLRRAMEQLERLRLFNEADERRWAEAERDAERLRREKERLREELKEKEGACRELKEALQDQETAFRRVERSKEAVDREIRPALRNYRAGREALIRQESKEGLYRFSAAAAAFLLVLSLAGALLTPLFIFNITAALGAAGAAWAWFSLYRLAGERGKLNAVLEQVRSGLLRCGLAVDDREEDIEQSIESFMEEYDAAQGEIQRLRSELVSLERQGESLRERLRRLDEELAEVAAVTEGIKRRAGVETLADYARGLRLKGEQERLAGEQRSVLTGLFGRPSSGEPEHPSCWEDSVNQLAAYRHRAPGVVYREEEAARLKLEQEEHRRRVEEIRAKMDAHQSRLAEIEREINRVLRADPEPIYCQTVMDLEAARRRLAAFMAHHETFRQDALAVIALFEEIQREEKGRVMELFGEDSPVSGYFRRITGGLYRSVNFDGDRGGVVVRRRDGIDLPAEKLSGGAFDQLYLSIRLALGEKLLQGRRGFFIMDDPFIKSDTARLQAQLQTLLQLAGEGRQIIYFSAKDEVLDALQPAIAAGTVHHITIQ